MLSYVGVYGLVDGIQTMSCEGYGVHGCITYLPTYSEPVILIQL